MQLFLLFPSYLVQPFFPFLLVLSFLRLFSFAPLTLVLFSFHPIIVFVVICLLFPSAISFAFLLRLFLLFPPSISSSFHLIINAISFWLLLPVFFLLTFYGFFIILIVFFSFTLIIGVAEFLTTFSTSRPLIFDDVFYLPPFSFVIVRFQLVFFPTFPFFIVLHVVAFQHPPAFSLFPVFIFTLCLGCVFISLLFFYLIVPASPFPIWVVSPPSSSFPVLLSCPSLLSTYPLSAVPSTAALPYTFLQHSPHTVHLHLQFNQEARLVWLLLHPLVLWSNIRSYGWVPNLRWLCPSISRSYPLSLPFPSF